VIRALAPMLDDEARRDLDRANEAFRTYREAEANVAASEFRGGTLERVEFLGTWTGITHARTRSLSAQLEEPRRVRR
jgi:uncharacterized protein YecT (DUF1311 family)